MSKYYYKCSHCTLYNSPNDKIFGSLKEAIVYTLETDDIDFCELVEFVGFGKTKSRGTMFFIPDCIGVKYCDPVCYVYKDAKIYIKKKKYDMVIKKVVGCRNDFVKDFVRINDKTYLLICVRNIAKNSIELWGVRTVEGQYKPEIIKFKKVEEK